ncbi:MAG: metalloregulator ArsR/SmtB family transcription factor [Myxococcota bacterium]|nr:metalloregulator ArsR/SmtB family transcription factor [Myxococcota bacterium]
MNTNDDTPPDCAPESHHSHTHELQPDWVIERGVAMFKAMGDTARLRILETLFDGRHCVSELSAESGDAMSTVSQRLKILMNAGLVVRERSGKHMYYALADDHIVDLIRNALEHAGEHWH